MRPGLSVWGFPSRPLHLGFISFRTALRCSKGEGNPHMLRPGRMLHPKPPSTPPPSHRRPTPNIRTRRTARTRSGSNLSDVGVHATHWTGPRPLELDHLTTDFLMHCVCLLAVNMPMQSPAWLERRTVLNPFTIMSINMSTLKVSNYHCTVLVVIKAPPYFRRH